RHRTTADLRAAEAETESDADRRAQLEREAGDARALAQLLDRRAAKLEQADEARALWYAHTAETRAAEQRARIELAARGIDPDQPEHKTTAAEWLAAQQAGQAVDDRHREITDEVELSHVVERRAADVDAVDWQPHADAAE